MMEGRLSFLRAVVERNFLDVHDLVTLLGIEVEDILDRFQDFLIAQEGVLCNSVDYDQPEEYDDSDAAQGNTFDDGGIGEFEGDNDEGSYDGEGFP